MSANKTYVREDEHGALRVGATRVLLDSVLAAFEEGHSPETIRQQYPSLSLEDVYGAITYYLAHSAAVNEYLARQDARWAEARRLADSTRSPVIERLRVLRATTMRRDP